MSLHIDLEEDGDEEVVCYEIPQPPKLVRANARFYDDVWKQDEEKLREELEIDQSILEFMAELRNRNHDDIREERRSRLEVPTNPYMFSGNQEEALEWDMFHLDDTE